MTPRGLERRIGKLEDSRRGGPCEECGFDGDLSKAELEVTWKDVDALEDGQGRYPEPDPQPEWCGTCGHQTVYVVTWADLPDEGRAR